MKWHVYINDKGNSVGARDNLADAVSDSEYLAYMLDSMVSVRSERRELIYKAEKGDHGEEGRNGGGGEAT